MDALARRDVSLSVIVAGRSDDPVPSVQPPQGANWKYVRKVRERSKWRRDVVAEIASIAPDLVLLEHGARLDFCWTVLADRSLRASKILWTHGIERRERFTGRGSLGSIGRWCQLRLAQGIICYDEETAGTLRARLRGKIIGSARNTIDRSEMSIERQTLQAIGRAAHRESLGLANRFYLVALGRLIEEKEFHRIPNVVSIAKAGGLDVGMIVVGDGPEKARIQAACEAAGLRLGRDVFMPGEVTEPQQIMRWLYASDLCVNPGCLGLSVVDCAHAGVPIVSVFPGRKGPYHGPEWRYVIEGATGWFAPENTDRAIAALTIAYLRRPEEERASFERECVRNATANLGVDEMVNGILRTCREVQALSGSRR